MNFTRKVTLQAADSFPPKSDICAIDAYILAERVPGELVVSYPGNGGRTSITFRSKPKVRVGEIPPSTQEP